MPQLQLPVFPDGLTFITEDLAFQREDGKVFYFHGLMPVFQHEEKDLKTFRMYTSQLIASGQVRQRDIVRAFGVPQATVKRYMKLHREQGAAGFYRPSRRRSASVLTPEVRERAQALLREGKSVPEVSREIGVAGNTLHKAIRAGRLHAFKKNADARGGQQQERTQPERQPGADGLRCDPLAGTGGRRHGDLGSGADYF
jgi:transposase-like protein